MRTRFFNSDGSFSTLPNDFDFNRQHSIYLQNSTTLRYAYNQQNGYYRNYIDYCLFGEDTWYLCNRNDNAYIEVGPICTSHSCFNNREDFEYLQVHNLESEVYFPIISALIFGFILFFIYKITIGRFIK